MEGLGYATDLLVPPASEVTEREGYRVVRTPGHADFWFGNLLQLDRAPLPGELDAWRERWRAELGGDGLRRLVLAWESARPALPEALRAGAEQAGLEPGENAVLRLDRLVPARRPHGFAARAAASDADWDAALAIGNAESPEHADFARRMQAAYRERAAAGRGAWWIGRLDGEAVSSAGIYWDETGRVARYQRVDTLAGFRGRGCAPALLTAMAEDVTARLPALEHLVIVAERGEPPERIYGRLGFAPVSYQASLLGPVPGA